MPEIPTQSQPTSNQQSINWKRVLVVVVIGAVLIGLGLIILLILQPKPEETTLTTASKTATTSTKKDETADWKVYKSTKSAYLIKYPKSWFVTLDLTNSTPDLPGSNMYILNLTSCDSNKESQCRYEDKENFLQITVFDKYTESLNNYIKAATADKETTTLVLDNETAIRYSHKQNGNLSLLHHHVVVKHVDNVYDIEFVLNTDSTTAEQKKSEKIFDQILSAFKFLD